MRRRKKKDSQRDLGTDHMRLSYLSHTQKGANLPRNYKKLMTSSLRGRN